MWRRLRVSVGSRPLGLGEIMGCLSLQAKLINTSTKTCPCKTERFFSVAKIENFIRNFLIVFLIFAQNIDCGYTLEPPRRLTICLLVNRSECPSLPRKNGSSPIIYTFISRWVYLVNRIKNFRACSGNVVKVKPGAHNLICS